jgi:hypothetical protein
VLDAVEDDCIHPTDLHRIAAAALRAAADQVVPELGRPRTADERTLYHEGRLDAVIRHRQHLLAIAAELEGGNG